MRGDRAVSTADARAAFLNDEPVGAAVRQSILASWARSRELQVAPDKIDLGREPGTHRASPLLELAAPVVEDVTDLMATEPVSVILCDDLGVVLERRTGDSSLQQYLDRVWLAPGFSYAERFVGTNGIGTALESRGPAYVVGHEHWAEGLESLACAATPVRHPVTRRIVGVLNLTCWRRDAGRTLASTAALVARQVEDGLREHVGRREAALLDDFLTTCRRHRGAVLAVSEDLVMLNDDARDLLEPGDQSRVVTAAAEMLASGRRSRQVVDLPSGATVRLDCRPTWSDAGAGGGVLVVRPVARAPLPVPVDVPVAAARGAAGRPGPAPTSGAVAAVPLGRRATGRPRAVAVGSGTLWTMGRQAVDRHLAAREWLVLRGEPGSGRRTLARAAHEAHSPGARLRVVDPHEAGAGWAVEVAAELVRRDGTLVVTDVDRLGPADAARLMDLLEPHRWSTVRDRPWVVLTVGAERADDAVARLVERFPATVDVPPLRHHGEDVPELVAHLLAGLGHSRLTCSPEAIRVLTRCRWPGNVGQLRDVLGRVVARRRSGVAEVQDLPADVFVGVRRRLTTVEALECDAIVGALRQTGGSKTKAAALVGMSRATIYRKVREYGISLPDDAPGLVVPRV